MNEWLSDGKRFVNNWIASRWWAPFWWNFGFFSRHVQFSLNYFKNQLINHQRCARTRLEMNRNQQKRKEKKRKIQSNEHTLVKCHVERPRTLKFGNTQTWNYFIKLQQPQDHIIACSAQLYLSVSLPTFIHVNWNVARARALRKLNNV